MPIRNLQRGPAAGGAPVGFTNLPNANGVYVDGLTDELYLGSSTSGTSAAPLVSGGAYKVLAATITYTSNVTAAVITGFSWTVAAGATYIFEANLPATMTTNGGLTVSFKLTTATLASIQYQSYAATATDNATAVSTNGTTTTDATKMFDDKTAAYTHVNVKGSFVTTLGGTFALYGCQNTSAGGGDVTSVLIGSYAKLIRVA